MEKRGDESIMIRGNFSISCTIHKHHPLQSQPTTFSLSFSFSLSVPKAALRFIPWSLLTCFSGSRFSLFPFIVSHTFFSFFPFLCCWGHKEKEEGTDLYQLFSLLQILSSSVSLLSFFFPNWVFISTLCLVSYFLLPLLLFLSQLGYIKGLQLAVHVLVSSNLKALSFFGKSDLQAVLP